MGEPDNFPHLASPAISKAPFEMTDRPMRQMLPQSDGNGSVQRKLLNRRDRVLPMTALPLHGHTDMGHSLSPDISRYILPYSDSVGITAWRLI
jgi:hypothetical protein